MSTSSSSHGNTAPSVLLPDPAVPFHRWIKERITDISTANISSSASISPSTIVTSTSTISSSSTTVVSTIPTVSDKPFLPTNIQSEPAHRKQSMAPLPSWSTFIHDVQRYRSSLSQTPTSTQPGTTTVSSSSYIGPCNQWYTTSMDLFSLLPTNKQTLPIPLDPSLPLPSAVSTPTADEGIEPPLRKNDRLFSLLKELDSLPSLPVGKDTKKTKKKKNMDDDKEEDNYSIPEWFLQLFLRHSIVPFLTSTTSESASTLTSTPPGTLLPATFIQNHPRLNEAFIDTTIDNNNNNVSSSSSTSTVDPSFPSFPCGLSSDPHYQAFETLSLQSLGSILINTFNPGDRSITMNIQRYHYLAAKLKDYEQIMQDYLTETEPLSFFSSPSSPPSHDLPNVSSPESVSLPPNGDGLRRSIRLRTPRNDQPTKEGINNDVWRNKVLKYLPIMKALQTFLGSYIDRLATADVTQAPSTLLPSPSSFSRSESDESSWSASASEGSVSTLPSSSLSSSILDSGSSRILVLNFYHTCITLRTATCGTAIATTASATSQVNEASVPSPSVPSLSSSNLVNTLFDWEYSYPHLLSTLRRYVMAGYKLILIEDYSTAYKMEEENFFREAASERFSSSSFTTQSKPPKTKKETRVFPYGPADIILRLCVRIQQFLETIGVPAQIFVTLPSFVTRKHGTTSSSSPLSSSSSTIASTFLSPSYSSLFTKPNPGIWFILNWFQNNNVNIDYTYSLFVHRDSSRNEPPSPCIGTTNTSVPSLSLVKRSSTIPITTNPSSSFDSCISEEDLYFTINCNLPCTNEKIFFGTEILTEIVKGTTTSVMRNSTMVSASEDNNLSAKVSWLINPVQEYRNFIHQYRLSAGVGNGQPCTTSCTTSTESTRNHRMVPFPLPWPIAAKLTTEEIPDHGDETLLREFLTLNQGEESVPRGCRGIFVLIGLPGSGKSTIVRNYFTATVDNPRPSIPQYLCINMDIVKTQNDAVELATYILERTNILKENNQNNATINNGFETLHDGCTGTNRTVGIDTSGNLQWIPTSSASSSSSSSSSVPIQPFPFPTTSNSESNLSSSSSLSSSSLYSCLSYSLIIDGTHIDNSSRYVWYEVAVRYSIPLYGIYINTPYEKCIYQSKIRKYNPLRMNKDDYTDYRRYIPVRIIQDMYSRIEPPLRYASDNTTVMMMNPNTSTTDNYRNETVLRWTKLFIVHGRTPNDKDNEIITDHNNHGKGHSCWTCYFLHTLRNNLM